MTISFETAKVMDGYVPKFAGVLKVNGIDIFEPIGIIELYRNVKVLFPDVVNWVSLTVIVVVLTVTELEKYISVTIVGNTRVNMTPEGNTI
jgi:hypothetical protein